ncbi:hypothetical protein TIFTF001_038663 [Ficus carica]|uniref:Uncharacterized protein n=1 Tax=Ficus carica TaxID=3494 RepID=A0AA88JD57_FICCA|nr:hypothetical protein TIFTF001_038663 [Ficus carica]
MVLGKDRDMLRDCGEGSDIVDEKIRRLPAGGETWDRKIKRKRSVGPLGRPSEDGEPKRAMHHKLNNDPGSSSCDAQTFRSGSTNGTNKFDGASLPASSNGRAIPKNELEKVSLSRDSMPGISKERLKGNNKYVPTPSDTILLVIWLNVREDNQIISPNSLIKGKASRAPRSGALIAGNLSPNFPRTSGSLEGWEQPASVSKICSINVSINRNRPVTPGSSSPSMAQWGGQRPHKISRTRRTTIVSPVSNHDEVQISPEGCSPSDLGTRFTVSGTNGSLARAMSNGSQQLKVKHENISSPARLSESEESGACENRDSRLKEKGAGSGEVEERGANSFLNTVPSTLHTKKSKITIKEETGDSVRRQGRNCRGSSFTRVNTSPVKEKLENLASTKPLKSARLGPERNNCKSGRPPLKKISERKGIARLGHINSIGSPDFAGELDDDREELKAAANFACNASYLACSSPFWKQMQSIFAPVSLEETSYLKEQLKYMEVNYESLSQMFGLGNNTLRNCIEENFVSQAYVSEGKERTLQDQVWDLDSVGGRLDLERRKKVPPLYQRVLSALIIEDETEEFEGDSGGRVTCFQYNGEYTSDAELERRNMVRDPQTFQQSAAEGFSCNDNGNFIKGKSIHNQLFRNELFKGDQVGPHLDNGMLLEFSENGVDGSLSVCTNASRISSFDCAYEQMSMEDKLLLELQSVGLDPEIVPNLAEGDDEAINSDILGLQKGLFEQVGKTKVRLKTIGTAIEEGNEVQKRGLEQVAMDRLVELAYKKLLATRGSFASKHGVAKVPKQVAMNFMKRTLARCRKHEDTGKSCFSEPALRDIIYSAPAQGNDPELTSCVGSAPDVQNSQLEPRLSGSLSDWAECCYRQVDIIGRTSPNGFGNLSHSSEQDFAKTGPIMNRGKKKELLLDDVGGNPSLKATSSFGNNLQGGAKGKRSERERDRDTTTRNSIAKAGRLPLGNNKGERKTKTKPKQKTGQLSTSGNVSINSMHTTATGSGDIVGNGSNRKREAGLMSQGDNNPGNQSTDIRDPLDFPNLQLNELDSIELGVVNDLDGHQDLSSWLNIEEDGLQDHDALQYDVPRTIELTLTCRKMQLVNTVASKPFMYPIQQANTRRCNEFLAA